MGKKAMFVCVFDVCVCGCLCVQIVTGRDALQERALTLNPTSNADDKTDEHR